MKNISQIVLGLSAAAIFIGAMFILSPSGSTNKSVRYVFALTFLCTCIGLFAGVSGVKFDFTTQNKAPDYTTAKKLTEHQAEYICAAALSDKNISFDKILVSTDIDESSGIFISNIEVYSAANDQLIKKIINETVLTKEVTVR